MKKIAVYERGKLLRRFGAVVFDLITVFIFTIIFASLITEPLIMNFSDYNVLYENIRTQSLESRLYILNDEGELDVITSNYDDALTYFYTNYDDIENYNQKKAESNLFTYDETTSSYIEIGSEKDLKEFYRLTVIEARDTILFTSEKFYKVASKLEAYNFLIIFIACIPSFFIVFLIIPLIFYDRATIGMKLLKLKLVSKRSGMIASRVEVTFKFLIFLLFEVIAAVYTFGLTAVISMIMVAVTPARTSFSDLICSVYTVDSSEQNKNIKEINQIVIPYYDIGEKEHGQK